MGTIKSDEHLNFRKKEIPFGLWYEEFSCLVLDLSSFY